MDFSQMFSNWPKYDLGLGAFYALFGFLFVFLGITLLVGIIWLVGFAISKWNRRGERKTPAPAPKAVPDVEDGIPPEVVAAITAAVAACYSARPEPCEFVVKRIGRRRP